MKSPNTIEDTLNKTRERLYEETKNMTINERITYLKSLSAPILKEHGLRTVSQKQADERRKKDAVLS